MEILYPKTQFKDKIIQSNLIENVKNDHIVKLEKTQI